MFRGASRRRYTVRDVIGPPRIFVREQRMQTVPVRPKPLVSLLLTLVLAPAVHLISRWNKFAALCGDFNYGIGDGQSVGHSTAMNSDRATERERERESVAGLPEASSHRRTCTSPSRCSHSKTNPATDPRTLSLAGAQI